MTKTRVAALVMVMACGGGGVARAACQGDCNGDRVVTINELIAGVNIALGTAAVAQCSALDANDDGRVAVNELVAAVLRATTACPNLGAYTSRVDVGDGQTATIHLEVGRDGHATGTLVVAATAPRGRAALRVQIPLVNLSGTVDLDTGAYHLSGSVEGQTGPVPVDVRGTLPQRIGDLGTLQLAIASDTFTGTVVSGDGAPSPTPSPTRTPLAATATAAATSTPGNFPTPPANTCKEGSISVVFTAASGTNSYSDLAPVGLGKLSARVQNMSFLHTFGGVAVPCTVQIGDIIRKLDFGVFASSEVAVGTAYPLGDGTGLSYVSYLELPSTNPLGARGWKAHGGALIIDSIAGDTARFRIIDAQMVFEPSFSAQTPATGTFVLNASGVATNIFAQ
jgi:hypothetical protein